MAANCRYVEQLRESCRLIGEQVGRTDWSLVYQSRSGPPSQPWLEPDICDHLVQLSRQPGVRDVVVVPVGFVSDHLEVKYDLDTEAAARCEQLGLNLVRRHGRNASAVRGYDSRADPGADVGSSRAACPGAAGAESRRVSGRLLPVDPLCSPAACHDRLKGVGILFPI